MKPDDAAVAAQIHAANAVLRRLGKVPCEFELQEVPLADIKPSQFGEDCDNPSSRELARKTANGQPSDRKQDNWPIAVDEAGTIIDGNHRHAAATIEGAEGGLRVGGQEAAMSVVGHDTEAAITSGEFACGREEGCGSRFRGLNG